MSYLGKVDMNDANILRYTLTSSTASTVLFSALGWTPANIQSLRVTINGVVQQNISLTSTALDLGGALVATDELEVIGIESMGNIITPADNSVTEAKLATTGVASASTYLSGTMAWGAISSEDSVKVLSKAANYTILDTDVDDVGTLYVLVDASAATRTITLPAPADYNGVVIKVIASVAPGTGYSVIVNNSGGSEIWTCYAIGDFYTGISDGTSNIKADGKVSVRGKIYSSVNQTPTGRAYVKTTYDTSKYDVGGWGDLTNNRINVAFDCMISVMSVVQAENQGHPTIYVDGTNWLDTHDSSYESSGYQREVTFVQKVLASETPIEMYYFVDYAGVRTMRGGEYKIYAAWEVLERI